MMSAGVAASLSTFGVRRTKMWTHTAGKRGERSTAGRQTSCQRCVVVWALIKLFGAAHYLHGTQTMETLTMTAKTSLRVKQIGHGINSVYMQNRTGPRTCVCVCGYGITVIQSIVRNLLEEAGRKTFERRAYQLRSWRWALNAPFLIALQSRFMNFNRRNQLHSFPVAMAFLAIRHTHTGSPFSTRFDITTASRILCYFWSRNGLGSIN